MTAPRRRWLDRLRTMFVWAGIVFIVLGGWASYQLSWIRERHTFLDKYGGYEIDPTVEAPWSIRIFGEFGHDTIQVRIPPRATSESELLAKAKELFPEAINIDGDGR